jgi:WD40 repeat protein
MATQISFHVSWNGKAKYNYGLALHARSVIVNIAGEAGMSRGAVNCHALLHGNLCAEVTSVEMNKAGSLLLSGSKDNSNRLWDVRLVSALLFTTAL